MINVYDIAYGLGVGLASPIWMSKRTARKKVLGAFRERMGHTKNRDTRRRAVMVHAVSVGEINATPALLKNLRARRPDLDFIISTTTTKGWERAQELYGSADDVTVIRYPLDFSSAVERVLDTQRPAMVVLMELEVWPNFLRRCRQRKIPVLLANGRLTTRSFKRYRMAKALTWPMFSRLAGVCVQDQTYADRFIDLGASADRVYVTGTMKFDNAQVVDRIAGSEALANDVGLQSGREPIWVCGSTGPEEERIILQVYRSLLPRFSRLRLVIVPRKPERFDEVAQLIESFRFKLVRRSQPGPLPIDPPLPPVVLGDTMGELRKFYSLATITFVGRSLVDLGVSQHGSDMIEAAGLAKPIIVGPYTTNFADAMRAFRAADGVGVVEDVPTLTEAVATLLSSPAEAMAMGLRAQEVVRQQQGATDRHVEHILELLPPGGVLAEAVH